MKKRRLACVSCLALSMACGSARLDPPPVEESSLAEPSALVRVRFEQPFSPTCLIVLRGDTVEWRNLTPLLPVSVVGTGSPPTLSSPALAAPYQYLGPQASPECALLQGGSCLERAPISYWRHTFPNAGVFPYKDGSGGQVAQSGAYAYGLPMPMASGVVRTGLVCVRSAPDSSDCNQVCCINQSDCTRGATCTQGICTGGP